MSQDGFSNVLTILHRLGLSNELETFLFVLRNSSLEEDGVCSILCVKEWIVAVDLDEEVDAVVTLVEVGVILGQGDWTTGAPRTAFFK